MSLKEEIKADIESQKLIDEEKKQKKEKASKFKKTASNLKQNKNIIFNSILLMLFTTIAGVCIMYYVQKNITELNVHINNEYVASDSKIVINTKKYIDAIATAKLKDISAQLTTDIYSELDMAELKRELERGEVSPELESIFREAILDKCSVPGLDKDINNIFICNSDGILADFSNIYASDSDIPRTWEVESSRQQNIELFTNSIQAMVKQDVTALFVEESTINTNQDHKVITRMTEDDLINILNTEGIEGIKNYTFLVPVYIMENNDIFGANDIINGHRVTNNKFILVQRYNLYDYIEIYHINESFDHSSVNFQFNTIYTLIYIFIIIYFISILIFLSYSIIILNRAIEEQNRDNEKNSYKKVDRNAGIGSIDPYAMTGRRAYDKYSAEIIRLLQEERHRVNHDNTGDGVAKEAYEHVTSNQEEAK